MNTQLVFDRLDYVTKLEASGFDARQARGAADALGAALTEGVATKSDVADLKSEIKDVRSEIKDVKSEIKDVRSEVKAVEASLKTDIAKLETRIILWLVGLLITLIPIGAALAAFIFKHIP